MGPELSGGRVGKSSHGANTISKDLKTVFKIASELDKFNKERQILEREVLIKL